MSNTPKIRFAGFTEEWGPLKLSDIGEVVTGTTPSTQHPEYYSEDGIPWVTPTDITDNLIYDTPRKLSPSGETVARVVPAETVLVTCIASIGKNALLAKTGSFNQQINGIVPNKKKYDPYFLLTESYHWSAKMKREAAAGTMQIVNKNEFSAIKTYIPELLEQQIIGRHFKAIDEIITLQQREYEKLVALKAACLNKMFPKNGSKVPQMRFAGFAKSWEQSKFKDSFEFLTNNTLSRADLDERNGSIYNLHYGDILVKFGETLNLERDSLPFISDKTNVPKTDFLKNGDVIITDTAEDDAVGKCTEIVGASDSKIVSGLHTIPCRPYKKFAKGYLGYFMNSPVYHDQLVPLMQGTKVTSVSKSALQSTMIYYPSDIKEQTLIGEFFMGLNNLITLQEQKVKKLKQLKQAMLHNMFV